MMATESIGMELSIVILQSQVGGSMSTFRDASFTGSMPVLAEPASETFNPSWMHHPCTQKADFSNVQVTGIQTGASDGEAVVASS